MSHMSSVPINLGWLNWMRRFKFLNPVVQHIAVGKTKRKLNAQGIKYTTTKLLNGDVQITCKLEG